MDMHIIHHVILMDMYIIHYVTLMDTYMSWEVKHSINLVTQGDQYFGACNKGHSFVRIAVFLKFIATQSISYCDLKKSSWLKLTYKTLQYNN